MTEIWKPVKNYEGLYEISNYGRIKRLAYTREIQKQTMTFKDKMLKPIIHQNGYLVVSLSKNNKQKIYSIHRLVAQTFISNPNNYKYINHKDEDKTNNQVDNLEWCDNKYNLNYGTRNERASKSLGKKIKCVETGIIYNSMTDVERKLKIAHNTISKVCQGKRHTAGGYHWEYVKESEVKTSL